MEIFPDLDLEVRGAEGVQFALRRLRGRVQDARPAFRLVDKHLTTVFRRQFETEGRFGGSPWPPLKPATIRAREQAGRGRGGILRDTNRLWGSLVKGGNVPEGILVIDALRYVRGTQVPYAADHQTGVPEQNLPPRPPIPDPMPPEVLRVWERIFLRFFSGELEA